MAGDKRKTELILVNYPKKNPLTNGEIGSNLEQNYTSLYLMSGKISKDVFETLYQDKAHQVGKSYINKSSKISFRANGTF